MNRNSKVIKGIGVVALSGVVATSALTMTGCGKKTSKADSVVITLADGENNGEECLTSTWLPLRQITTNSDFREAFETLTHNRTTSNSLKEGTIYYTSNPTLQTSLKNSAFVSIFESIESSDLLSLVSDLYLDLDETTSPDILKAAVINTYFDLFNTKQSQSQNEFNATQRISRVDFISAVVKSTTSPQSNEANLSENDIMSKLVDKSYLGINNTNNTETGIITKAEAAYMICNTLFNNEMSEQKADKPAENLQSCLESGELSSDLRESLEILESKGVISSDSFVANWNKALSKSEAVDLIYKSLEISGLNSSDAVNEDVIAEEIAEAEAKLAKAKEDCKQYISGFSLIDQDSFNAQIDEATSEDELASIKESADEANKDAQEQMIKNSQSSTPSRRGFSITTTTGGPDTGSGSGSGTSGGGYTRGNKKGPGLDNGDGNTELEHGQGGYNLK